MDAHRRFSLALIVALFLAALSLGSLASRPELSDDAAAQLRRGTAVVDSLRRPAADRSASQVVALGYLERLRLGVGGAYRLIDYATRDPRLGDSLRTRLAWGMLARIRMGESYATDPAAFDDIGPGRDSAAAPGEAHLALIARTVAADDDPRVGELAVRLGYALSAAEGTIRPEGARLAVDAAALVRDRILAMRDARTVLERLRLSGGSLADAVAALRRDHTLAVERPAVQALDAERLQRALRLTTELRDSLRALGASGAGATGEGMLDGAAAARLASLGTLFPPQTPVSVALRLHAGALPTLADGSSDGVEAVGHPANEETLVAAHAVLAAAPRSERREPARAVLRAAVQLRAYAQEEPWFPGDAAPTAGDLSRDFGLASVSFDGDVPRAWRGYYLRMLQTSMSDMQDVLGGLDLTGLRVRFGVRNLPDTVLAMHDPRTRTLALSITSSAGTLAHELAHDLDWQTSRRLYRGVAGYSTDHAARDARGLLGHSMRGLAAARLADVGGATTSGRPAELFARDVDWLVADALARDGRSNGYLSAAQDAALPGYAGADPRDLLAGGGSALVDAVQAMAYLDPETVDRFLADWSDPLVTDPYVVVERALAAVSQRRPSRLVARSDAPPALAPALGGEGAGCARDERWSPEVRARSQLLSLVVDARARGIVRRWAEWYAPADRPAWASSVLGVAPYAPDEGARAIARTRARVAGQLDAAGAARSPLGAIALFLPGAGCPATP